MALIKCQECGKEISDKATSCPHCGCPLIEKNHCIINGVDVDCSFIFNDYDIELRQMEMMEYTNLTASVADKIVEEWSKTGKIPPVFNGKTIEEENKEWNEKVIQSPNIPKCPTCGSTNLSKISNVGKAAKIGLFGIFGAGDLGKTWKCNNCGSKW